MGFLDLFLMALMDVAAADHGERFGETAPSDDGEALWDDGYDDYVGDGLDGTYDDDDYDDYDDE